MEFDETAKTATQLTNIVDECTREALTMRVGRHCAEDLIIELERLVVTYGAPASLRCDNGPELIANALREWCRLSRIGIRYIEPGSPWENLAKFRTRMGWTDPFYSSFDSDFNYDIHVTLDEAVAPVEYNFRTKAELEEAGQPWATQGEPPGASVFFGDGDSIFHTYSTYARGLEQLLGIYDYLDLTPFGRQLHVGEAQ